MLHDLTLHSHPIEWSWLAVTVLDVWVSTSSWLAAHRDWKRAESECNKLTIAERVIRAARDGITYAIEVSSLLNAILATMLCAAAIVSLFLPPPPPDYTTARQSLWIILVLIGASTLNAIIAVYGRLTRYRLQTGYFERRAQHKATKPTGKVIADAFKMTPERKEQPK